MNQTNTGTVSKQRCGKFVREGVERIRVFPRTYIRSCTDLDCHATNQKLLLQSCVALQSDCGAKLSQTSYATTRKRCGKGHIFVNVWGKVPRISIESNR